MDYVVIYDIMNKELFILPNAAHPNPGRSVRHHRENGPSWLATCTL